MTAHLTVHSHDLSTIPSIRSFSLKKVTSGAIDFSFTHTTSKYQLAFYDGVVCLGSIQVQCNYFSPVEHFGIMTATQNILVAPKSPTEESFVDLMRKARVNAVDYESLTIVSLRECGKQKIVIGPEVTGYLRFHTCEVFQAKGKNELKPYVIGVATAQLRIYRGE